MKFIISLLFIVTLFNVKAQDTAKCFLLVTDTTAYYEILTASDHGFRSLYGSYMTDLKDVPDGGLGFKMKYELEVIEGYYVTDYNILDSKLPKIKYLDRFKKPIWEKYIVWSAKERL